MGELGDTVEQYWKNQHQHHRLGSLSVNSSRPSEAHFNEKELKQIEVVQLAYVSTAGKWQSWTWSLVNKVASMALLFTILMC